jgi:GT2 family glycosyltransferase
MMPDEVSVIVPVWNGRAMVERLIGSLRDQTYPIAEILIVDNGSQDGAPECAEQMGARVIRMGSNTGFSHAVNRGIEACRTEWLAIINSDVTLAPDWLECLITAARQPDIWFAAGKILNASRPELIDGTYDAVCRGGCAWRLGHGRPDGREFSNACDIWFAPGTASLFRAGLFRQVGLFDERFESYLEDVDLGLRCACLNHHGRYVPLAVAYHAGSATLGQWHRETVRRISRNQVLLIAKHYPARVLLWWAWPILVAQTLWGLVALRHRTFGAFLRGKFEGLTLFRTARRHTSGRARQAGRLASILLDSERDIHHIQRLTGFDWFWRVYFALTSGAAD